jgi:hypothetical protein
VDGNENLTSWQHAFRVGFAPLLSVEALTALADALAKDSPKLIQGATCTPPPLVCVGGWPVEAACLIGYAGWRGEGLETVDEVSEYFGRLCKAADDLLGEPAGCRWVLNAWDENPRHEAVPAFLAEVNRELARRGAPGDVALTAAV